jgi:hypothetical protein
MVVESGVARRLKSSVGDRDIGDFMEHLSSRSKVVQIYFHWRPALRDRDDDRILEVWSECSRQL